MHHFLLGLVRAHTRVLTHTPFLQVAVSPDLASNVLAKISAAMDVVEEGSGGSSRKEKLHRKFQNIRRQ